MGTAETLLWTERYRPRDLADLAMSSSNRALVEKAIESEEIPHLLLHGPAGCGKTSLAFIVRDALDCRALVLNASKERGIDVVRERIGRFVRGRFGVRWNIVILDEADYLTTEAQTALRNMMETHAETARFVLTANYPHRIKDPIRSRCVEIAMAQMELRDRVKTLLRILSREEIDADPKIALGYAERYPDLRRMITAAQRSVWSSDGELRPAREEGLVTGPEVLAMVLEGDYPAVREVARDPATDHAELLRQMFWAVPDDAPRASNLRMTLATSYDATPDVPDPVVHFLGTAAEIIATVA